ncbi:hypothetical protein E4U42_006707 [Claviceps africana]|uniref:Endoplasmic reticulum lectin n=1 Tax=Claviceps africana TaxID=83212 RepID=A0A8K0NGJ8_9HYPO|nr:hypothetical protein E4U42_006707 [Claviceps africana]
MRRFSLVLLAGFQLAAAKSRSFSVHDDLFAFPQFEVVFAPDRVSEKQAQALMDDDNQHATYSAEFPQAAASDAHATTDTAAAPAAPETSRSVDSDGITGYAYEILNLSPHRYLCSIPMVQPPALANETENALAKAEEDREYHRASAKGWELINNFEDGCLYYVSGWWSYSFCKNREIVQFHAITVGGNGQPPRPDPNGQEYILGQVPSLPAPTGGRHRNKKRGADDDDDDNRPPPPAELQMKGDQPYLVQRLEGGTMCDLTGKERTIEVRYQCVPGLDEDRIGWIKEVVTCSYIMMVDTPRLCNDVAFQPAVEKRANPIRCQLISERDDSPQPLLDQHASSEQTQAEQTGEAANAAETVDGDVVKQQGETPRVTVGGVLVGGKRVLSSGNEDGKPVKLQQLANLFAPQPKVLEVVAQAASKSDGGKVTEMTPEELEALDVDPKAVQEMREKIQRLAGELGWRMEVYQMNEDDEQELLGYIDEPETAKGKPGEDAKRSKGGRTDAARARPQQKDDKEAGEGESSKRRGGAEKERKTGDDPAGDGRGSEEAFRRDEL